MTALAGPSTANTAHRSATIWVPVWRDNFTGPRGALPSSSRWILDTGCGIAGGMAECDTTDPRNVSLDGHGHLDITARSTGDGQYTSARIRTRREGFVPPPHGILRIAARLRIPAATGGTGAGGLDAAFWTWGSALLHGGDWPASGEMDIAENYPSYPGRAAATLWCPGSRCGTFPQPGIHALSDPVAAGYHTYAIVWQRNPDRLIWTVDNRPYLTATPRDTGSSGWVFDKPFFPLLSILVGGALGTPTASDFPATMSIDSVTVSLGTRPANWHDQISSQ